LVDFQFGAETTGKTAKFGDFQNRLKRDNRGLARRESPYSWGCELVGNFQRGNAGPRTDWLDAV
jgi:hypothetical protein